jgi:alkanesulfonate monooxygenase SsuD/methylene tetrahydromethanopterin reductase-like flavin-dependent oxidoreductase (luciferase family)
VEFGIFNSGYVPNVLDTGLDRVLEHERFMNEIEFVKAADRSGFKYIWATEHHFLKEYSHLSSNEAFLAYAAGVTERIHLGSGIFNITPPVSPPARVAEKVAMIDHLSGGRFEFGMGRGSSSTEQKGFGIEDPELTKAMFAEVIPEFKKMWRDEPYSFEGKFFSMPERDVLPKPYTNPHPPMWVAAGNPGTFETAARMGLGVLCFTTGTPDSLAPLIEIYKKEIKNAEPVGDYVNNNVMVTSNMMCLEDGQRARDIACNMGSGRHTSLVFKYLDTFPKPAAIPDWPELMPDFTPELMNMMIDMGAFTIGTPDECANCVQKYADAGADQLTFGMLSSTLPIDIVVEAVETFGREVIPRFDKDPMHSTQRQREEQIGA